METAECRSRLLDYVLLPGLLIFSLIFKDAEHPQLPVTEVSLTDNQLF